MAAENCFADNLNRFIDVQRDPAAWNLNAGLLAMAQQLTAMARQIEAQQHQIAALERLVRAARER